MAKAGSSSRNTDLLDSSLMGRQLRPEAKQAIRRLFGGALKLGADVARAQAQYGLTPLVAPIAVARSLATAPAPKAAARARRSAPSPFTGLRQAARKKEELVADNAQSWGGAIADGTREFADEVTNTFNTAPARAASNLDTFVPHWRDYRAAAMAAPAWLAHAADDLREAPIREGRKYFTQINPYRTEHILRANEISDPNSPAAKAVLANERQFSRQLYASEQAKWDAISDWAKPLRAFHYGAERGAFGPMWAMARAHARSGGWQEDAYQAERLPYTFAYEDHPLAYASGALIGALAADRVSAGTLGPMSSAVDGYLSEPGDMPTRLVNAGTGLAGDWLAGKVAEPLQKYAARAIKSVGKRVFAAPHFAFPGSVVSGPPVSAAPFALPRRGAEPLQVRVSAPANPMTRQAHFEGRAAPVGNGWSFSPDPTMTRYGADLPITRQADAPAARFTLPSRLESLRPDLSPTLAELGFHLAPTVVDGLIEAPVDLAADEASDASADMINTMRAAYIAARRRERLGRDNKAQPLDDQGQRVSQ